jgi:heme oxygenase
MSYDSARVMELLKESTEDQHRDAERRRLQKDMVQGRLHTDRYRVWVGQMYLLHRTLSDEIDRCRGECAPLRAVVRDEGLHVEHLRADLAALGCDADAVEPLPATARALEQIRRTARVDSLSLLGYNYVLEGSMNGNRFIARALGPALEVAAVSYLDPYGDEQRPLWLAYRERMNAVGFDAGQAETMVRAAQDMFTFVAEMSDAVMETTVPA